MSRGLCNKLMGEYGSYAATLRDVPTGQLDEILGQKVSILSTILALLQNVLRIKFH